MVEALEAAVIKYHAAEDPRWLALLSAWHNAIGVIRRRHLLRSEPFKGHGLDLLCVVQQGQAEAQPHGL